MTKKIKIGTRLVGEGEPCFIICDAGANHDRKLSQAKKLIDIAAEAMVDAVKFQTYSAETLYSRKTPQFSNVKEVAPNQITYELIKSIELPREWQPELAAYAKKRGIMFLSTPFDKAAVDELDALGMPAFKWASFEIVDLPLLKYTALKRKPMIISTGMCNLADIQDAVSTVMAAGNNKIILLHCISLYPTAPQLVNLRMMDTIRDAFHLPVGLSDHTTGIAVPVAAAARGACVVEKHFTISRKLKGPDHPFALEPPELKQMVIHIREVEKSLGSGVKEMIPEEKEMARFGRRSIIARVDIPRGTTITRDMLIVKRPGYGIAPKFLNILVGRKAMRDIKAEYVITWKMV